MAHERWEYRISISRGEMAQMGEEGWELVSAAVVAGTETFYYKKRTPSIRELLTLSQHDQALAGKEAGADEAQRHSESGA